MKITKILFWAMFVVALSVGCNPAEENVDPNDKKPGDEQVDGEGWISTTTALLNFGKSKEELSFVLINVGDDVSPYSIKANKPGFSFSSDEGMLEVGEKVEITVTAERASMNSTSAVITVKTDNNEIEIKTSIEYMLTSGNSVGMKFYGGFEFNDRDDEPRLFSDIIAENQLVLFDFWATWCGPCQGEIPVLEEDYNEFKDQGFMVVGVALESGDTKSSIDFWKSAIEGNDYILTGADGTEYHCNIGKTTYLQLFAGGSANNLEIHKRYDVSGIPRSLLVGKDGIIVDENLRGSGVATAVKKYFEENK